MPSANGPPTFTLNKSDAVLHLLALPFSLYVHRFPRATAVPPALFTHDFVTVSKTPAEVSIVAPEGACEAAGMPRTALEHAGGPWTALRVRGPLEHHMVGVLSEIARVLKEAEVSIFAISTWDTDYILVTSDTVDKAKSALSADGWQWA